MVSLQPEIKFHSVIEITVHSNFNAGAIIQTGWENLPEKILVQKQSSVYNKFMSSQIT